MTTIGGSGISDNYGGGAGGLTETQVQALIDDAIAAQVPTLLTDAFSDAQADGKLGWIRSDAFPMIGKGALELFGVPVEANEVIVAFQGVSATGTSSFYYNLLDESGGIADANTHYGYFSSLGSSIAGTSWNPGNVGLITNSPPAANYISGQVRFTRQLGGDFCSVSTLFDAGTRNMVSIMTTPGVGAGMTGVRLFLGTAGVTWDSGHARISWRR